MTVLWIILIFYKSLLVVELMKHDVNISRETAEALLPKNRGIQKFFDENLPQYLFLKQSSPSPLQLGQPSTKTAPTYTSSTPISDTTTSANPATSTINFLQLNLYDFLTIKKLNSSLEKQPFESSNTEHTWETLNYYHWLTLFNNYNVSLYNRYVAILPEIRLNRLVKQADVLRYRNKDEVRVFNSVLVLHEQDIFVSNNMKVNEKATEVNLNKRLDWAEENEDEEKTFKWALLELFGIVVLGIFFIFLNLFLSLIRLRCADNN